MRFEGFNVGGIFSRGAGGAGHRLHVGGCRGGTKTGRAATVRAVRNRLELAGKHASLDGIRGNDNDAKRVVGGGGGLPSVNVYIGSLQGRVYGAKTGGFDVEWVTPHQ